MAQHPNHLVANLAPTLRKGDTVFMDNLRTHKIEGARKAIEAVGARLQASTHHDADDGVFTRIEATGT